MLLTDQCVVVSLYRCSDSVFWLRLTSTCTTLRAYVLMRPRVYVNVEMLQDCGCLPANLGRLFLYGPRHIPELNLPVRLTTLYLDDFNDRVMDWSLPETLRVLRFRRSFNQPVLGWKLPAGLIGLDMGSAFNQPVITHRNDGTVTQWILPNKLKWLILGRSFNRGVVQWKLPDSLLILIFGNLRKPMVGWKPPPKLRDLRFHGSFNSPLSWRLLPNTLENLELGQDYTHFVPRNQLPKSLETLYISGVARRLF